MQMIKLCKKKMENLTMYMSKYYSADERKDPLQWMITCFKGLGKDEFPVLSEIEQGLTSCLNNSIVSDYFTRGQSIVVGWYILLFCWLSSLWRRQWAYNALQLLEVPIE